MKAASVNTKGRKPESQEVAESARASVRAAGVSHTLITKPALIKGDRRDCGRQVCVRASRTRVCGPFTNHVVLQKRKYLTAPTAVTWFAGFLFTGAESASVVDRPYPTGYVGISRLFAIRL